MRKSQLIFAKLDPGFFHNRKVIRAGRNGRDVFLFALCTNASRGGHGTIPAEDLEPWYLARELGITEQEAAEGVTAARYAGLIEIDGDHASIAGWDQDWARRPLTNAERQAKFRETHHGVTESPLRSNGKVTRNGSEERRGEERETRVTREDSLSGSSDPGDTAPDARPPRTRKRPEAAHPLDSGWEPSAALTAVAHELGLDFAHELAQFRLNARARGHRFVDANAAFEQFMRRSRDAGKSKPKPKEGAVTSKPRVTRIVLENGNTLEEHPDGTERVLAPDGSVIREGKAESYTRKGSK